MTENFENTQECLPQALERESKYHSADYNCHHCDDNTCNFYTEFNPEVQAEQDEARIWQI